MIGLSLAALVAMTSSASAATNSPSVASGSVAAITGTSMEVQNSQSGQTTVSWTTATTFSQTVTVKASSVVAGDCVTATGASSKGVITAKSVTVSQPTAGKCNAGMGGRGPGGSFAGRGFRPGGGAPGGTGSAGAPNGGAGNRPTRAGGFGGAGFAFASGKVTSVTKDGLVISGISSNAGAKPSKTTKTTSKQPATKTIHLAVKSSTTYTTEQAAAATNLAVGDCVTASGSSDSTGAVAASNVRITSTGGKTCMSGFGGGAFGGGTNGG